MTENQFKVKRYTLKTFKFIFEPTWDKPQFSSLLYVSVKKTISIQ